MGCSQDAILPLEKHIDHHYIYRYYNWPFYIGIWNIAQKFYGIGWYLLVPVRIKFWIVLMYKSDWAI